MTTDTTKTEHEGPIRWTDERGDHRLTTFHDDADGDGNSDTVDTQVADLIAALSANPQLRAAVLSALDKGSCAKCGKSGVDEMLCCGPCTGEMLRAAESELAEARAALAETLQLAEERLNERNQLRADLDAEQSGRLATRARYGAREDETFGAFIQRLVTESIEAQSALAAARLENSDLSYQLGKAQGEAEGHALVRKGLEAELERVNRMRAAEGHVYRRRIAEQRKQLRACDKFRSQLRGMKAQLEAARASAADPGELEHLRESCAALSAQVDALENLVGEATKHVESDTRAEWLSEQVLALRSISARDQKRAAPVAEEPRRPNYCPSCDTVAVTGTVRCPACSRVLIAQPDVDSLCACGHRYGAHERGTNGPCKDCDCAHWREPAAAQPSPAQEPKPPAGHWSDCAECVRDGGYCLKHPAQPEPAIDTALFDGLPNWLDDMRDALGDFHPDSPLHVSAAKLGEFAGATLAFLNGLHEHLKEQKPLTRANVTAIVDARVAELAKAAAELKRGSNAAWPMLALAEAAEGKGS